MRVTNDHTNVFDFFGASGIGPGKHADSEMLSSTALADIYNIYNKLSWCTSYSFLSDEGHYSFYFGCLVFRKFDGTMGGYLDYSTAEFGIDIDYNKDASSLIEIFDDSENEFEVPLKSDVVFENFNPYTRIDIIYEDNAVVNRFKPHVYSYNFKTDRVVKFKLIDCLDGTFMTGTQLNSLPDYALKINIFGHKPILKEDL